MTPSPEAMSSSDLLERLRNRRASDTPTLIDAMNVEYNERCNRVMAEDRRRAEAKVRSERFSERFWTCFWVGVMILSVFALLGGATFTSP